SHRTLRAFPTRRSSDLEPDAQALNFQRTQAPQPYRLQAERRPNVVFVMLESLGTSAVGAYGNPLNPTPNIDRLAKESWFFEHFRSEEHTSELSHVKISY